MRTEEIKMSLTEIIECLENLRYSCKNIIALIREFGRMWNTIEIQIKH